LSKTAEVSADAASIMAIMADFEEYPQWWAPRRLDAADSASYVGIERQVLPTNQDLSGLWLGEHQGFEPKVVLCRLTHRM
jgi:hypothetical protein